MPVSGGKGCDRYSAGGAKEYWDPCKWNGVRICSFSGEGGRLSYQCGYWDNYGCGIFAGWKKWQDPWFGEHAESTVSLWCGCDIQNPGGRKWRVGCTVPQDSAGN